MKYEVGDTVFFLESNRFVRKETDLLWLVALMREGKLWQFGDFS